MKKLLHLNLFIIANLFLFIPNSFSRHIISGMMNYECLGNNDYQITMILYRDCNCTDCAYYDDPAYFNIYRNNNLHDQVQIQVESIEQIASSSIETCTDEFGAYCVDRGIYSFMVNLPTTNSTYSIVYQRCCWAGSVANMLNPEEVGISIMTEITPKAQEVCNSQYLYEDALAFVACPATEVSLNIPSFDTEGDSLAVEMCLPFQGAGPNGYSIPGDPNNCEGILPLVSCPPPYDEVVLQEGFSAANPFPTEDGIHLDPSTNTISFIPTTIGRYIFSLCFTEFRNGEILSQYRSIVHSQIQPKTMVSTDEIQANSEVQIVAAQERVYISSTTPFGNATARLLDMHGRVLTQTTIQNAPQRMISTAQFSSGVYIVLVQTETGETTVKKVYVE